MSDNDGPIILSVYRHPPTDRIGIVLLGHSGVTATFLLPLDQATALFHTLGMILDTNHDNEHPEEDTP